MLHPLTYPPTHLPLSPFTQPVPAAAAWQAERAKAEEEKEKAAASAREQADFTTAVQARVLVLTQQAEERAEECRGYKERVRDLKRDLETKGGQVETREGLISGITEEAAGLRNQLRLVEEKATAKQLMYQVTTQPTLPTYTLCSPLLSSALLCSPPSSAPSASTCTPNKRMRTLQLT
jgi:hypothetical protein